MSSVDASPSRWSAVWSVLANWRDWNLPAKLAAVTLVPVVFAIVLGTMQISDQVDEASSYRRVDRLVVVNQELRDLVAAVQAERSAAGVLLAARATDLVPELADEQRAVDAARAEFLRAAGRATLDNEITAARYAEALSWLDELTDVRRQVEGPRFAPAGAIDRYTDVIDSLLRFHRIMAAEAIDPELAATSAALYDLEAIKEQTRYQHALIAVGIVAGGLTGPDQEALAESENRLADRVTDFYAVAGANGGDLYDSTVTGTAVASRNTVVDNVVSNPPGAEVPSTTQDWNDDSALTASRVADVAAVLGVDLRDRSAALQDAASDRAGLAAVILLVALVVAVGVMFVVGRHLLRSLSALRRGALDVAERALPDAVARIRDQGEDAAIQLDPVPVRSMDEVGQVARAFDAVQRQALRLATEQASLRARYSSVFVNLSRRSQGLVQRQLHLLEQLERDEEDADQLATLFQLDHLATRMRRNNENLMVLSGGDLGRRNQREASLADVLRASVSEIEHYQRVVLLPPPNVEVVGYAVGDIVRLVAELLDNATAFSAPGTQVTIASRSLDDGSLSIVVLDDGIGMSRAELDEANEKLADVGSIDVSSSRRMGLFVIGRLAGRHGIDVRLDVGQDGTGVRATVTVPDDVVTSTAPPPAVDQERPSAANGTSLLVPFSLGGAPGPVNGHPNGGANGHQNGANGVIRNGLTPAPLPRRTGGDTNGDTNGDTDIARRLGGGQEPAPAEEPLPEEEPVADATSTETPGAETPQTDGSGDSTGGGRPPLPRRSPGGRVPGPQAGPAGPADLARQRGPSTPPERGPAVRDDLFTPASDRDDAGRWSGGGAEDRSALEETTPIFDEMASAWFRAVSHPSFDETEVAAAAPVVPGSPPPSPEQEEAWRFAADFGFQAARAVSRSKPADFTSTGLPRRSPSQNLVPGSAGPEANPRAPRHSRDADDVREKLSSYRHGVRRARDHRQSTEPEKAPQGAPPVTPPHHAAPAGSTPDSFTPDVFTPESATTHGVDGATTGSATTDTVPLDLSGVGWRFAADVGWRAATEASANTLADFTSGGLPRRSPKENLIPGSISDNLGGSGNGNGAGAGGAAAPLTAHHAEEMRGRLGSFQKGLSRGRRSLAERSSAPGFHDHEQQQESE